MITKTETKPLPRMEEYGEFTSPHRKDGLPIDVRYKDQNVYAWVTIPPTHSGWRSPDVTYAHQGSVATVLVAITSWQAIHSTQQVAIGRSLNLEFFQFIPVGKEIRADAKVVGHIGDREIIVEGLLYDAENKLLARASGTFSLYTTQDLHKVNTSAAACVKADLAQMSELLAKV